MGSEYSTNSLGQDAQGDISCSGASRSDPQLSEGWLRCTAPSLNHKPRLEDQVAIAQEHLGEDSDPNLSELYSTRLQSSHRVDSLGSTSLA